MSCLGRTGEFGGEHVPERGGAHGARVRRHGRVLLGLLPQQVEVGRAQQPGHRRDAEIAVELPDEADRQAAQSRTSPASTRALTAMLEGRADG
jgi:hypothetical protein